MGLNLTRSSRWGIPRRMRALPATSKASTKRGKQRRGDKLRRRTHRPESLFARRRRRSIPWPLRSLRFRPQLPNARKLLAPPIGDAHQLVGAAFEHLMRLELQRLNPMAEPGNCVAAHAVDLAEREARAGGSVLVGIDLVPSNFGSGLTTVYSRSTNPDQAVKQLRVALQNAKNHDREYIQNGILTRGLLTSCWSIAKIIGSFRGAERGSAGLIPYNFPSTDEPCLSDIAAMFTLIDRDALRAQRRCLLRPVFCGEHQIGANQPDFVIDDMLIDVKCTARKSLDRRDVDQLLRYYALSKIEGLAGHEGEGEINRLAIYYARFAQLFVIDVRKDFPRERVTKFLEWFEQKHRRAIEHSPVTA